MVCTIEGEQIFEHFWKFFGENFGSNYFRKNTNTTVSKYYRVYNEICEQIMFGMYAMVHVISVLVFRSK